jgi:uncharacterized protein
MKAKKISLYNVFFFILFTAIPAITFINWQPWFESKGTASVLFPLSVSSNSVVVYTLVNTVIMFFVFLIWHFTYGRKHGGNALTYGLFTSQEEKKFKWSYIGKVFIFAFIIVLAGLIVVTIVDKTSLIEFRFWGSAIKTMRANRILYLFTYFIPFLICYLVMGVVFNAIFKSDDDGTRISIIKNMIIGVAVGVAGLIVLFTIWYTVFYIRGFPAWYNGASTAFMGKCGYQGSPCKYIPNFAIASALNSYFVIKTKNIYVGAFVTAMFMTWIIVASGCLDLL